jgi:hypothetical protein
LFAGLTDVTTHRSLRNRHPSASNAQQAFAGKRLQLQQTGVALLVGECQHIGPDLYRAACDIRLEGLVSKRSDRPYRGGRSPHWIKVKNRQHPAMTRVMESIR